MIAVAVVGLGGMGSRIAGRLLAAGHPVTVWNRSPAKAAGLVAAGATAAGSPADAAERADAVITMVADPAALQAVTEGPDGVAAGLAVRVRATAGPPAAHDPPAAYDPPTGNPPTGTPSAGNPSAGNPSAGDPSAGDPPAAAINRGASWPVLIEMSTVGPAALARLGSLLPAGAGLVDAPVMGAPAAAQAGELTIFVGGPPPLVELVLPLLTELGSVHHVGGSGAGAAAKLVANASLFGVLSMLGEAVALADALGLARQTTYEVLAATPLAAEAERRRPAIESGDYPPRFPLRLARKDARLVADAAAAAGVGLPVTEAAGAWLAEAERAGLADRDYTALIAAILAGASQPGPVPPASPPPGRPPRR